MYQVNKGVDRPPEVLGIRGIKYLLYLAGSAVVGMVFATIFMVLGLNSFIAYGGVGLVLFGIYSKLASYSKEHGERGLVKFQSRNRYPLLIRVQSSSQYRDMINPGKNGIKTSGWDKLKRKRKS
jgi:hypothetical protein